MSFNNLIGANVSKEIQDDIDRLNRFTLFLKEVDVADLNKVCNDLPDDEYVHEAALILGYFKNVGNESYPMITYIQNVFSEAFEPFNYSVPAVKILDWLVNDQQITLKGK